MEEQTMRISIPVLLLSGAVTSALSPWSGAQEFPSRPLRILVAGAGGSSDVAARVIALGMSANLKHQVIVQNRAGGQIAIETAMQASPDGYTLLLYTNGLWILPLIQKAGYDAVRDFVPVTLAVSSPNMLVVNPQLAARSVKELIAHAKANPGQLNYASGAAGSPPHLAGELFKSMAGVNIVRVNYKGAGPGLAAVMAGEVQLMFPSAGAAAGHVKAGRLRALAIATAQPSPLFAGLPTVIASGLPGYESVSPFGVYAPAGTPPVLVTQLHQHIARVLARDDVREKFFGMGMTTVGSAPAEFGAFMKSDIARMARLIKEAGISAE